MNEIVNKFLLAGDTFMPEMHSKQPAFTFSACGPFTKNKERIQKFKETGDTKYISKNELDKACFQHDMAYGDFSRIQQEEQLLLKIQNLMDIKEVLFLWFTIFLMPQKNEIKQHQQLAEELHRPIIKKCKEEKFILLKDNIWSTDLADMQLISKFNKRNRFLLCVIDIFSKYAWVVPLKDKKGITIVSAFQNILDNSSRKPNKIWVDKASEFYNSSFKNGPKIMIQKCLQHTMKENLLLLKDLLELEKTKFITI